jgi:hypothetical protein
VHKLQDILLWIATWTYIGGAGTAFLTVDRDIFLAFASTTDGAVFVERERVNEIAECVPDVCPTRRVAVRNDILARAQLYSGEKWYIKFGAMTRWLGHRRR